MRSILLIFTIIAFSKFCTIDVTLKEKYGNYIVKSGVMAITKKDNIFYLTNKDGILGIYHTSNWAITEIKK